MLFYILKSVDQNKFQICENGKRGKAARDKYIIYIYVYTYIFT